jgi:hypothetical protein
MNFLIELVGSVCTFVSATFFFFPFLFLWDIVDRLLFSIYCAGKNKISFMLNTLRACLHNIPIDSNFLHEQLIVCQY